MGENARKKCPQCGGRLIFGIMSRGIIDKLDVSEQFANVLCCIHCLYNEPFALVPKVPDSPKTNSETTTN